MKLLKAGTIKRIHVDRRVMAQNRKTGGTLPAWTIQTSKGPVKCSYWQLCGITYGDQSRRPLSCGARMFVETRAAVQYR